MWHPIVHRRTVYRPSVVEDRESQEWTADDDSKSDPEEHHHDDACVVEEKVKIKVLRII